MGKAVIAQPRPKVIDLFCGAGGMSLGFEQAGFDIVLGADMDGHHVAVHKRNFPNHATILASVVDLNADRIFEAIGGPTEIDVVCGGPPCQGFSNMGLRDTQDPRNSLVSHFARLVAEIRPKVFVMENVPGMASGETKPFLDHVVKFLSEAGYNITSPVQVLDASTLGVPQKRKRLFVLGARKDLKVTLSYPSGPQPTQPSRPTVWEAIGDLPDVEGKEELFSSDETAYDKVPTSAYAKVARDLVRDGSDYSYPRDWPKSQCSGCLRIRHVASAVALYNATLPGSTVPGHKLPKLHPEGICTTLRAGSDSTHGSHTAPRPVHPKQPRCITAREAARLHGFPDWFSFYPTKWHAYRQIGNAVCPPVARAIGLSIMKSLGIVPTKPTAFVHVNGTFELSDERPRALKRIPHVRNYPPVIAHLFAAAYDDKKKKLKKGCFSFQDVEAAIRATAVNLPWTRADTFVPELARSRRVRQLLSACLEKGYTIRPTTEEGFIGEFVREGEPGSITDKDLIEIKSRDMTSSLPLHLRLTPDQVPNILLDPVAVQSIWDGKHSIERCTSVKLKAAGDASITYRLLNGRGAVGDFLVVVSQEGNLPTKARIQRYAESAGLQDVLLLAAVTSHHVAAIRFEGCLTAPSEARRCVFKVEISDKVEQTLFGPVVVPVQKGRRKKTVK